jgi:hypothetical protein
MKKALTFLGSVEGELKKCRDWTRGKHALLQDFSSFDRPKGVGAFLYGPASPAFFM